MKKEQILKLIDECPYWGEDAESEVMIKDLKKWFEFKLGEINGFEDDVVYITRKEFKFEINRLWNEIRQISSKLIVGNNIYSYSGGTHTDKPIITSSGTNITFT